MEGEDTSQLHTPESVEKRMETNRRNHNGMLAWSTPESRIKARATIAANYNGDPFGQIRSEESYETNRRNHGGVLHIHTEEIRLRAKGSLMTNKVIERIKDLKELNLEITPENYIKTYYRNHVYRSFIRIFNNFDSLNLDYWTEEMIKLFSDIYDYCNLWWPDWVAENIKTSNKFKELLIK